jgi:hypothetical protein
MMHGVSDDYSGIGLVISTTVLLLALRVISGSSAPEYPSLEGTERLFKNNLWCGRPACSMQPRRPYHKVQSNSRTAANFSGCLSRQWATGNHDSTPLCGRQCDQPTRLTHVMLSRNSVDAWESQKAGEMTRQQQADPMMPRAALSAIEIRSCQLGNQDADNPW